MSIEWIGIALVAALGGLGLGVFVGRRTSADTVRARALEGELEDTRKEHEIALAEVEAARHKLNRTEAELERYRREVVDHFSGTSEMLRDLTLQYRHVFDHITEGAKLLCPEGSLRVPAGEGASQLPPGAESDGDGPVPDDAEAPPAR